MTRTVECPVCGTVFETENSQRKYCCLECRDYAKMARARLVRENDTEIRRERIQKFQQIEQERKEAEAKKEAAKKCRGCEWHAPGEKKCRMPRCMKRVLASEWKPRPLTAEWHLTRDGRRYCDNCYRIAEPKGYDGILDYCPHCGAYMRSKT